MITGTRGNSPLTGIPKIGSLVFGICKDPTRLLTNEFDLSKSLEFLNRPYPDEALAFLQSSRFWARYIRTALFSGIRDLLAYRKLSFSAPISCFSDTAFKKRQSCDSESRLHSQLVNSYPLDMVCDCYIMMFYKHDLY